MVKFQKIFVFDDQKLKLTQKQSSNLISIKILEKVANIFSKKSGECFLSQRIRLNYIFSENSE